MAYGDNRQAGVTDTFDSEIDGNWANGPDDWGGYVWATGGFVNVAADDTNSAMRYDGSSFDGDHWSTVTFAAQDSGSYHGASARHQDSPNEAGYSHVSSSEDDQYQLWYHEDNLADSHFLLGFADPGSEIPMGSGDTITLEVEGNVLRGGSNAGGADTQKVTDTHNDLSGGRPGIGGYEGDSDDGTDITAFAAGSIGAVGGATIPVFYHHYNRNLQ